MCIRYDSVGQIALGMAQVHQLYIDASAREAFAVYMAKIQGRWKLVGLAAS
jgi:hypothetical protein